MFKVITHSLLGAIWLTIHVALAFADDKPLYFARNPTGDINNLAFEYNSRIWLMTNGGHARRLTKSELEETSPSMSPDGKTIAFVSSDGYSTEIFAASISTGKTTRLTYDGGSDSKVQGWLSNTQLLYSTTIKSKKRGPLLFTVNVENRKTAAVPLAEVSEACVMGDTLIFVRNEKLVDNIKMYRGGYAQKIYKISASILDKHVGDYRTTPLSESYDGVSRQPLCINDRIYFLTDRSGWFNIWSMLVDGSDLQQHTWHADADIQSISATRSGSILYAKQGDVFVLHPNTNKNEAVPVFLPPEQLSHLEMMEFEPTQSSELQITDDAKTVLLVIRGNLWSVDVETSEATCLECSAAARTKSIRIDRSGKVFLLLDASGEYRINLFEVGSKFPKEIRNLISEPIESITVSPDGKTIVATTVSRKLFKVNTATGETREIKFESKTTPRWLSWSSDSKKLALVAYTTQDIGQVLLLDMVCDVVVKVSSDKYESYFPKFSSDNKTLYFISETNFRSSVEDPWAPRSFWPDYQNRGLIYAVNLEKAERVVSSQNTDAMKHVQVSSCKDSILKSSNELRSFQLATQELPYVAANYAMLFVTGNRITAVMQKAVRDERGKLVDFPTLSQTGRRAPRQLLDDNIYSIEWSPSSSAFVAIVDDGLITAQISSGDNVPLRKLMAPVKGMITVVNKSAERTQMFVELWRLYRDHFWDPSVVTSQKWKDALEKYMLILPKVSNRSEFNEVASSMISALSAGHTSLRMRSEAKRRVFLAGKLGGAFSDEGSEGVRVEEVFDGDFDLIEERSPLSLADPPIETGDMIISANGISIVDQRALDEVLEGRIGQFLSLTIKKSNGQVVQTSVRTIDAEDEAFLRYRHWAMENKKYVEKLSSGKVGYLHLYSSYERDLAMMMREYPVMQDKEGIILDLRGNNGGNIDAWILGLLQRRTWMYLNDRYNSILFKNPRDSFSGELVVLIDGDTYSDGELIAEGVRRLGLGTLVGTTTSGAGIWVNSSRTLVDGGAVRIPESRSYVKENGEVKWLIEGIGVQPDIKVDNDPHLFYRGFDAQLEAAIARVVN